MIVVCKWFSKLRNKDPLTNMFIISRQLDGDNRLGEVIDVGRITRRVELIPRFGKRASDPLTLGFVYCISFRCPVVFFDQIRLDSQDL